MVRESAGHRRDERDIDLITNHWLFILAMILLVMGCGLFPWESPAAENEAAKMQELEKRIHALEAHLGIPAPAPAPTNLDNLLQRLEALEKAVYAAPPAPPTVSAATSEFTGEVVAPPVPGAEAMPWQHWTGSEKDLEAFPQAQSASGGLLGGYGSQYGLEMRGYGILTYFHDTQREVDTFGADGLELDLTKKLTDWALIGIDLDFINEGKDPIFPPFRHPSYTAGGGVGIYSLGGTGGDDDDDFVLEQLFVRAQVADSLEITGGKFNVPVGLEKRDAYQRYNVLPSLLFPLWPRDLTGIMATWQVNDEFSLSPYVFNGWDLDENNNDSFLTALYANYQVLDDLNLASTVAYGAPFPDDNSDQAFLFDMELRYTGLPNTWLGLEYMFVTSEVNAIRRYRPLGHVNYHGVLGIAHYDFTEQFGLSLQSSLVRDMDGFLYGREQNRWEVSIIPSYRFTDTFELRLQYQHIEADEAITFPLLNPTRFEYASSDDVIVLSAILLF